MPSPPSVETLERLRPQVEQLIADAKLCDCGGRVLAARKIGGFSARKVIHWDETGEYPGWNIPSCPHDELCVDWGRFSVNAEPEPEPARFAPVPPPPPVPAQPVGSPPCPVVAAPAERPGAGAPELRSGVLVPVTVPEGRSTFRAAVAAPPRWAWLAGLSVVAFGVLLVVMTVVVQAAGFGVSTLAETVRDVDVEVVRVPPSTSVEEQR